MQAAEANLESAQAELAQTRQQSDSELTRLGSDYDQTKQSLDALEVSVHSLKAMVLLYLNSIFREKRDAKSTTHHIQTLKAKRLSAMNRNESPNISFIRWYCPVH